MKKYLRMSSAAVVNGALRVNFSLNLRLLNSNYLVLILKPDHRFITDNFPTTVFCSKIAVNFERQGKLVILLSYFQFSFITVYFGFNDDTFLGWSY